MSTTEAALQTFLPYPDFDRTASVLDDRRLGKQRVEVLQILRALTRPDYGWKSHPAVLMWRGHEEALASYGASICREWIGRGFADTCASKILDDVVEAGIHVVRAQRDLTGAGALPGWLGDERLHRSHRSALVRKDPGHYRAWFPDVPDDLDYVWPTHPDRSGGG